ncbi:hypothetical protein BROUX41_001479 [Berkeleyomyces rouxiae]|uniref:uncharacterized protein n=1 Tax=Berkeleyomyces rouxiae TaxID=2035830 RepID=UPI003B8139D6
MGKFHNAQSPKAANAQQQRPNKRKGDYNDSKSPKRRREPHAETATVDNTRSLKKGSGASRETLLTEIKALGGDDGDLDLVLDVDSESENEYAGGAAVNGNLLDDLKKFAAGLGIDAPADEDESAVKEEADEGDDDESEEEEEEKPKSKADLKKEQKEKEQKEKKQKKKEEKAKKKEEKKKAAEKEKAEETKKVEAAKANEAAAAERKNFDSKKSKMTFEPRADWHATELAPLPEPTSDDFTKYTTVIQVLRDHAHNLLEADAGLYSTTILSSSSHKFLSTIMASGTMSDKVSALTLAIQESPLHTARPFDALISLASKKSRSQAIIALNAVVDLLGPGLVLPANRRLRQFRMQPALIGALQASKTTKWSSDQPLPAGLTPQHLIYWSYEEWLKEAYFRVIQLLETWVTDEVDYSRSRAIDFIYNLLKEKPEQEANLLKLLVNKLGDRDRKVASRTSHLTLQIQTSHPGMKPIIVKTVEQEVLLRPGQSIRARYYGINTLNQTILSTKEAEVAEALLKIYFEQFTILLKSGDLGLPMSNEVTKEDESKEKRKRGPKAKPTSVQAGDSSEKLVAAILTGINRAVPFTSANSTILDDHLDTLFHVAHSSNFNTSIQALTLIQTLSFKRSLMMDRFYRTLYESLLDPRLITSSKQAMYLNLLLRALKSDVDVRRVKAFAKRIVQITSIHQPPFIIGLLYVLLQLRKTMPDLSTLLNEPEETLDDGEENKDVYDGRKRNPEFSNAHRTCLWEIAPLLTHYHPSVSVYAATFLAGRDLPQKPDLESHSLIRFLDKFVYKNPKEKDGSHGQSIMQPLQVKNDLKDMWLRSKSTVANSSTVNTASFWNKKQEDVAVEDVFFHEYFSQIGKAGQAAKKAAAADLEDDDNDEVFKALISGSGGAEEDSEAESDLGMEGYSDSDDDGENNGGAAIGDVDELGSEGEDGGWENGEGVALNLDSDDEEGGDDIFGDESDGDMEDDEPELQSTSAKKSRMSRKDFKALPTFASVDDYATLMENEEDEDMGM